MAESEQQSPGPRPRSSSKGWPGPSPQSKFKRQTGLLEMGSCSGQGEDLVCDNRSERDTEQTRARAVGPLPRVVGAWLPSDQSIRGPSDSRKQAVGQCLQALTYILLTQEKLYPTYRFRQAAVYENKLVKSSYFVCIILTTSYVTTNDVLFLVSLRRVTYKLLLEHDFKRPTTGFR